MRMDLLDQQRHKPVRGGDDEQGYIEKTNQSNIPRVEMDLLQHRASFCIL